MKMEAFSIEHLLRNLQDRLKSSCAIASDFFQKLNPSKPVENRKLLEERQAKQPKNVHNSPDNSGPSRHQLQELIRLYNQDDFTSFLPRAEQVAEKYSKNFEVHIMLGEVNRKLQNYDAAIVNYRTAIRIKPDYADAYINLGSTLKNSGQLDAAINTYKELLKIKPDDAEAYYNIGNTFKANNDSNAAIEYYQKAINSQPSYSEAYNNLGTTLMDKGELDGAIINYKKALSLKPDDAEIHYNIGNALQNKGALDEAIEYYRIAIEIFPDYANAYNNIAVALKSRGELDAAIKCYNKVLKIKPDDANAYYNMGISLKNKGDFSAALDCYKRALEITPDYAEAHNNMGTVLIDMFELDAAIKCLQNALKIKPDYAEAYCNIGNALQEKGELNAAINNYEKALLITPDYPEVRHILASLTGETTRSAPRAYVEKLFDSCAFKFERSLVDDLEYQTPKILSEMIVANHFNGSVGSVLDLGCGTGLAGAELRRFCSNLEGLDLSKLMIEEARKKNIYDRLTHSDIFDYLATEALDFNHFIATDVFIYLGEVSDLFRLIKSRNQRNGSLSFSTEHTEKPGFTLETTGRFSHSKTYIESLCKTFDFRISRFEKTNLRKEKGEFINGALYLLDF